MTYLLTPALRVVGVTVERIFIRCVNKFASRNELRRYSPRVPWKSGAKAMYEATSGLTLGYQRKAHYDKDKEQ